MIDLDRLFGPRDDEDREPYLGGVQCKRCKVWGLKWRETVDGWRLFENERVHPGNYMPLHECAKADPNDFEVIPDA